MPKKEKPSVEKKVPRDPWKESVERIVRAEDSDPFQILGPHWIDRDGQRVLAIRVFRPGAIEVQNPLAQRHRDFGFADSS